MSPSVITEGFHRQRLVAMPPSNGLDLTNGQILENNGLNPMNDGVLPSSNGLSLAKYSLDRNLHKAFPVVISGKGNYLYLKDGRRIFDSTAGSAVSSLGHGEKRVDHAIVAQLGSGIPYIASTFFANDPANALCEELIRNGTEGKMARAYLTGSGLTARFLLRERKHS